MKRTIGLIGGLIAGLVLSAQADPPIQRNLATTNTPAALPQAFRQALTSSSLTNITLWGTTADGMGNYTGAGFRDSSYLGGNLAIGTLRIVGPVGHGEAVDFSLNPDTYFDISSAVGTHLWNETDVPTGGFLVGGSSATNSVPIGMISAVNGYILNSNSLSIWPTSAPYPGAAYIGNSNGVVYILTSTPESTDWASTNKLAP